LQGKKEGGYTGLKYFFMGGYTGLKYFFISLLGIMFFLLGLTFTANNQSTVIWFYGLGLTFGALALCCDEGLTLETSAF